MRGVRLGAVVAAATLTLASCGGEEGGGAGPPPSPAESPEGSTTEATVTMTEGLQFDPAEVTIEVGGTVTWVNEASVDHTATGDPAKAADKADAELPEGAEPWDSRFVKPGDTFTMTFDFPGTYRYFCIPHENVDMLGVVEVVA